MTKKVAIVLAFVMLALVAWGLFFEAGATRLIALFCAAIFLLFVFAGIGIFVLGGVILAGLIMAGFAFPFLLVVLLPLAIVWLFIALTRKTGA